MNRGHSLFSKLDYGLIADKDIASNYVLINIHGVHVTTSMLIVLLKLAKPNWKIRSYNISSIIYI